jgi:hypothetical protein
VDLAEVVILGFTEDLERAKASLKDYKLEVFISFKYKTQPIHKGVS